MGFLTAMEMNVVAGWWLELGAGRRVEICCQAEARAKAGKGRQGRQLAQCTRRGMEAYGGRKILRGR